MNSACFKVFLWFWGYLWSIGSYRECCAGLGIRFIRLCLVRIFPLFVSLTAAMREVNTAKQNKVPSLERSLPRGGWWRAALWGSHRRVSHTLRTDSFLQHRQINPFGPVINQWLGVHHFGFNFRQKGAIWCNACFLPVFPWFLTLFPFLHFVFLILN